MKSLIFILLLTSSTIGQVTTKIYPFDGDTFSRFGQKVSINSNFIAVHSGDPDIFGNNAGAVYIYRIGIGKVNFVQKILPDTAYLGYLFGWPTVLADSLLLLGGGKKVHIYKCLNDSIFQKIDLLSPPDTTLEYGRAISKHNETLFVGASLDGNGDKGAAYYYEYSDSAGWEFKQKIKPVSLQRHAHFGERIIHNNQYAVISAAGDGFESGPFRGSVFLFEKTDSAWIEKQKILPSDSTYYQLFGIDLGFDDGRIAIGAVGNSLNLQYNGRVYIYEQNEDGIAELQDSIFASDNFPGNNFGFSFRLRGDSLFIGANGNLYPLNNSKVLDINNWAYLFVKTTNGWEEKIKFGPTAQNPENVFGYAVDFINGNFLVGSPGDPTIEFQCGAAYLFQPNISTVDEETYITDKFNLSQNYPNPFNPSTTIEFSLPEEAEISLRIYDILGRQVSIIYDGVKEAGIHKINWKPNGLSSGIYFYTLTADYFTATKKLILLR